MSEFNAYANDDEVLNIAGDALTVSNGTTCVTVSGKLEITKDKRGLAAALALKQALDSIVAQLQRHRDLPELANTEPPTATGSVDNPFN
ncbi:hypothetical protein C0Z18_28540 [Trinickia dabaoshanensis]|uniref:Uncharacterized protein n=1 Tax=Trinickia dabaoshanensis TaxID=564714 RepID=A0A2N7VDC4_9BURK|nr:hypothetical protein [Trinickia dabaoshanensis]PMS15114.1 hypothetical protein C0Z18_28540 [Trinickia dabaoshanensis]